MRAIIEKNHKKISELLSKDISLKTRGNPSKTGVQINLRDNQGRSALSFAAEKGDFISVRTLLGKYAAVDAKDNMDKTPLHHAAEKGQTKVINILLKQKLTDYNAKDIKGNTPILSAARKAQVTAVVLFFEKGAFDIQSLLETKKYL